RLGAPQGRLRRRLLIAQPAERQRAERERAERRKPPGTTAASPSMRLAFWPIATAMLTLSACGDSRPRPAPPPTPTTPVIQVPVEKKSASPKPVPRETPLVNALRALDDPDRLIRRQAVDALALEGEEAAAAIGGRLKDEDREVRYAAATALTRMGPRA